MGMRTDVLTEPDVLACLNKRASPMEEVHWSVLQCSYVQDVYDESVCIHLHETTVGSMYPDAKEIGMPTCCSNMLAEAASHTLFLWAPM